MSALLPARTAVLCYLVLGVSFAHAAERRPVAVIDLSDEAAGETLAGDLGEALNKHAELRPVDDPSMWKVLIGKIVDEDRDRIKEARESKIAAEASLERRDFATAASTADSGQTKLRFVMPTPPVLALYAELSFLTGFARLGLRKPAEATAAFRLAHDLDPTFMPDSLRVLPEVIEAFELAKQQKPVFGTIAVEGSGSRVFIDGKELTRETNWYPATAGMHVVWLAGPDRDARATVVTVSPQRKENATIDEAPTGKATRVARARIALKSAPDPTARAAAIRQLATLLEVRDAVMLTSSNGKLIVQTWRDQAPGFSALSEYKSKSRPTDLLVTLAPPPVKPKPPKAKKEIPIPLLIEERGWLARHKLWVGGGTLAAVVITAVIYGFSTWDRTFQNDPNPTFPQPEAKR
ncbi:MAG: hypothetical protein ABI867_42615 [Kofleriaceae bacterium]